MSASTATVTGGTREVTGMPALQTAGGCDDHRILRVPAGQSFADLVLPVVDDAEIEPSESIVLRIVPGVSPYDILRASAVIEIVDNDLPFVSIVPSDSRADEQGRDPGRFTIVRTGNIADPLTVSIAFSGTAGSADFERVPASNDIVIPAGADSITVVVTPVDDTEEESQESIVMAVTANGAYFRGSEFQAVVRIVDNDGANAAEPVGGVSDRDGDGVLN